MSESQLVQNLKAEMTRRGLNQHSLAKAANLKPDAVRDVLRGKSKNPRGDTVQKIAQYFQWPMDDLIGAAPESPDQTATDEADPSSAALAPTQAEPAAVESQEDVADAAHSRSQVLKSRDYRLKSAIVAIVDLMELEQLEAALPAMVKIMLPALRKMESASRSADLDADDMPPLRKHQ